MMDVRSTTNRRQFLQGKSAVHAVRQLVEQVGPDMVGEPPLGVPVIGDFQRPDFLVQIGRRAMACDFQIFLHARPPQGAVEASNQALDLVEALEDQMTVYRPHSEICTINRLAAIEPCTVEPQLFELLSRCVAWSSLTGGAFDITAGPLVKQWGFYQRSGRVPPDEEIQDVLNRVGSQYLRLDPVQRTLAFLRPEMELNLGSVGKGYALDRCSQLLRSSGVDDFLIHGGQSSVLARGYRDPRSPTPEWRVALCDPLRPSRRLAELLLSNTALGTSGHARQFFYHQGRRYGHVLDPRTGRPSDGVLSVSVLAPGAAEADALATAFFVMGVESTRAFCQQRPDLSVVFVLPGQRAGTVTIDTIAMDDRLRV
jgi:FAD:protein FMN transferase